MVGRRDEDDSEDNVFGAAYEGVTYRDTTDDGMEGELFEGGESVTDIELVGEAERIVERLSFLTTVARLWKFSATASATRGVAGRDGALAAWLEQANGNHRQLLDLLAAVHAHRVPPPRGTHESLVEYDRRRSVKETLLEEIIQTCVETADAARMIRASMTGPPPPLTDAEPWEASADEALRAVLHRDINRVRGVWPRLLRALADQPLLYVALGRGGNPRRIAASRDRQQVIRRLLTCLPRLGLLTETCRLLETAQLMEARHPAGPGRDYGVRRHLRSRLQGRGSLSGPLEKGVGNLFKNAGRAARKKRLPTPFSSDEELADCLEQLVEVLLRCWLRHSRGVRLSVLETVSQPQQWRQLKEFIERYGGDLFTQRFMNMANLRGILQQGVPEYLKAMRDEPDADEQFRLLAELDDALAAEEAAALAGRGHRGRG